MNWLGIDLRAVLATTLGAVLAFIVVRMAAERGVDVGWAVGLMVALIVAITARSAATMRGFFVGTVAVWTLAAAHSMPLEDGFQPGDLVASLARYHQQLDLGELIDVTATAVVGVALGMRSLRPGARRRLAGT